MNIDNLCAVESLYSVLYMIFMLAKMASHILQVCVCFMLLPNWLIFVGSASVDVTKTTSLHQFELSGNEIFYNAGQGTKKKLKDTGSKLENSILKSKVEALGEVLKKHVNSLRTASNKEVSFHGSDNA
jgi:hypothetical protein